MFSTSYVPCQTLRKKKLGIYTIILLYVNSFFGCSSQGGAFIYDSASRPLLKVRWALGGEWKSTEPGRRAAKTSKSWTRLRRCHCLLCWCWMPSQKLLKLTASLGGKNDIVVIHKKKSQLHRTQEFTPQTLRLKDKWFAMLETVQTSECNIFEIPGLIWAAGFKRGAGNRLAWISPQK